MLQNEEKITDGDDNGLNIDNEKNQNEDLNKNEQQIDQQEVKQQKDNQSDKIGTKNNNVKNIEILDMQDAQAINDVTIGAKRKQNAFQIGNKKPSDLGVVQSERNHKSSANILTPSESNNNTKRKLHNRSLSRPNMHSNTQSNFYGKKNSRTSSLYNIPYSSSSNIRKMNGTNLSKEFGDNIWPIKSSSVMTHSVLNYSIPKEERFNVSHKKSQSTSSMYNLNNTLGKRTTSMGIGVKGVFSRKWLNDTGAKPSPTHYELQSDFDRNKQSKSFGISHEFYSKVFPVGQPEYMSIEQSKKIPGPGTYRP